MKSNPFTQIPFPAAGGAYRVAGGDLVPDTGAPAKPKAAKPAPEPAPESDTAEPAPRKKRATPSEQE